MISEGQVKRLWAIARPKGWTTQGMRDLLAVEYKIEHVKDLTPYQYEALVAFVELSPAANITTMRRDPDTPDLFRDILNPAGEALK